MPVRKRTNQMNRRSQAMPYRERWNPASPNSSSRACYCEGENTYSRECCDGSLWAQGIGVITRIT